MGPFYNDDAKLSLLSELHCIWQIYWRLLDQDFMLRDGWNRSHLKEAKKRKRKKAKNCKHQSHENVTSAKKSKFEIIGDNSSQNVRSWSSLYIAAAARSIVDFWFIFKKKCIFSVFVISMPSISAVTQHKVQRYFGSYISGLVLGFITSIWSRAVTSVLELILAQKKSSISAVMQHNLLRHHVRGFILIVKFRVWLDIGQLLPA